MKEAARRLALALILIGCASAHADTALCGGFKRVDLKSDKGMCVGLVATHLGFVRGIAVVGDDIWVADMGGWSKGRGRLLRIKDHGRGKVEEMLTHLNQPNALLALPNGKLLVGSLGRVDEVDPQGAVARPLDGYGRERPRRAVPRRVRRAGVAAGRARVG